jgi:hypothetical protein
MHLYYRKRLFKNARAAGLAQVIERLHSKCEALNSNPSTAKRKKKDAKF